ncbi:hypothetical protein CYLTODRAFT_424396 [Cylindrobasidium torrendii FP15055 ss-10]|uniref:F-box domain-containing protein n=1 Tax=Cylindrobasidium torrendii FP15055 ss-10 TaxID=1314674 RepID=A0A0D7B793_9AGAR|nr:hypothetical protein CYLTODRAFT_424396 [Cylindrobasidium torrendii FP15055 ss-10]
MICQRCGLTTERPTRITENATPFPEYLGQNVCVEPATARRVADFLSTARKEEEEMASDIRTLEASLAQMKAEHAAAKKFIVKHEALLSHVHRLPNEILEHIFLFLPAALYWSTIPSTSWDDLGKWRITWVCQQWRTVAIQVAQLWDAVKIGDASSFKDNISPLLELSLSRTRGLLPLLLDVPTNQTEATYALILKYSAQIQILRYRIYVKESGEPEESRIPEDSDAHFESLKELTVFIDTDREVVDSDNCSLSSEDRCSQIRLDLDKHLSPFRLCASLQTLDLRIDTHSEEYGRKYPSCVFVEPEDMAIPWNNLSVFKLHIEDGSLVPLARILDACQRLETLKVDGYKGTYHGPRPTSLLLPKLSTIRFKNISCVSTLPTFNIPALQTLSLKEVGGNLDGLSSLFCLSRQLSTLRLPPCDELVLRKWRDAVAKTGPALDFLDLRVSSNLDHTFKHFESFSKVSSNPVLPLAREVRLEFPNHIDGGFAELMRWVQDDNNYLESLTLVFGEWSPWSVRRSWRGENCNCDSPTEEWSPWSVRRSWRGENRNCDSPTEDLKVLEWAEDKLRRSDFMVRVNSIARTGVTVKMIMKVRDGSETRVEQDYLCD